MVDRIAASSSQIDTKHLEITSEAKKWRDLSPIARKQERVFKILFIGLSIIGLIGLMVGTSYYILPTSVIHAGGEGFRTAHSVGIFVGLFAIPYLGVGCRINFEHHHNYDHLAKNNPEFINSMIQKWNKSSLGEIFSDLKGIGWMVRNGILTIDEANVLKKLYHKLKELDRSHEEEALNNELDHLSKVWDILRPNLTIFENKRGSELQQRLGPKRVHWNPVLSIRYFNG